MKNSLNLVFVVLLLVVLGCSCPVLKELMKQGQSTSPSETPYSANTASTPTFSTPVTTGSPSGTTLTMEKYNQIVIDMRRSDVEKILGSKGKEIASQKGGDRTFTTVQWEGGDYQGIFVVFGDDKVISKTQSNLK